MKDRADDEGDIRETLDTNAIYFLSITEQYVLS